MVVESWARLDGVGEELFLMLVFGDEVAEGDADEEGAVEFGALRALGPEGAEDFEEGEGVLAVAEAGLHTPSGVLDAGVVALDLSVGEVGFGLFACELVADGDAEGARVEVLHPEAHGGFMEELVGDGPRAFGGAMFGREDVGVSERLLDFGLGEVVAVGVFGLGSAEPVIHACAPDGVEELGHLGVVEG